MKAYCIREKNEFSSFIVFAETPGKAKSKALGHNDILDCDFKDLECHRYKECDSQYKNRDFMDWSDDEDRLFLVKECGWYCAEYREQDCKECVAKDYCDEKQTTLF